MTSEEDTFNALKRIPFERMVRKVALEWEMGDDESLTLYLKSFGWELADYHEEVEKRISIIKEKYCA